MKTRKPPAPPWPAFVDAIFAVLLIILLITILFLVFRVLYVVETELSIDPIKPKEELLFIIKKPNVLTESVKNADAKNIKFREFDGVLKTTLPYYQLLTSKEIIDQLNGFIASNKALSYSLVVKYSVVDQKNLRKFVYKYAVELMNTINKDRDNNVILEVLPNQQTNNLKVEMSVGKILEGRKEWQRKQK